MVKETTTIRITTTLAKWLKTKALVTEESYDSILKRLLKNKKQNK